MGSRDRNSAVCSRDRGLPPRGNMESSDVLGNSSVVSSSCLNMTMLFLRSFQFSYPPHCLSMPQCPCCLFIVVIIIVAIVVVNASVPAEMNMANGQLWASEMECYHL